jgi:hypothetical protein
MYEKVIMKHIFKNCKKKFKERGWGRGIRKSNRSNRGGEYDQSILYACMEISQ